MLPIIPPGGRFHPEDALAQFGDIEIDFQDLFLAPDQFDEERPPGFGQFPDPGPRPEGEDILGRLLGDGAAAAEFSDVSPVLAVHFAQFPPGKTVMLEEIDVLSGQDGPDHLGRNLVDRHIVLLRVIGLYLLVLPFPEVHERRPRHGRPLEDRHDEQAEDRGPERDPQEKPVGDASFLPCHGRE